MAAHPPAITDNLAAEPRDGDALATERAAGTFRLLVVASDTYPPQRVDVATLFGEELAQRGHRVDWILQSEAPCERSYVTSWKGNRVWVGSTDAGNSLWRRVRKHARGIAHDAKLFGILRRGDYDLIEV